MKTRHIIAASAAMLAMGATGLKAQDTDLPQGLDEKKNILVEMFSTEYCPNCPGGHQYVHQQTEGRDDIVFITHHTAYYSDRFTAQESLDLTPFFFNQDYTFAPTVMTNRKKFNLYDTKGPVAGTNKFSFMLKKVDELPTYATITMEKTFDKETRQLEVKVYGQCVAELANPVINIYFTEDSIKSDRQNGYDGIYTHNSTMRAAATPLEGQTVKLEGGQYMWQGTYEVPQSVTSPEDWGTGESVTTELNDEYVNVVAFFGNYNAEDPCDCEVLNVTTQRLLHDTMSAQSITAQPRCTFACRDGQICIDGTFGTAEIYTADGVLVAKTTEPRFTPQTKGIYIVRATGNGTTDTGKVVVR